MNVGNELLSRWTASGRRQLIGQAEILPIVISKLVWANLLRDMALVTYVDNDSALHAVVGGYTSVHDSAVLIHAAAHMDMLIGCHQWVARVPSLSNPADGPSRGVIEHPLDKAVVYTLTVPEADFWQDISEALYLEKGDFERLSACFAVAR